MSYVLGTLTVFCVLRCIALRCAVLQDDSRNRLATITFFLQGYLPATGCLSGVGRNEISIINLSTPRFTQTISDLLEQLVQSVLTSSMLLLNDFSTMDRLHYGQNF